MKKIVTLLLPVLAYAAVSCGGSSSNGEIILYQTNDRHSHMQGIPSCNYDPSITGDGTIGGAARWSKIFQDERNNNPNTLLFDAGDYSMGTMLEAANNNAADLDLMKQIGFTAAALGNHEFDNGPSGLANSINSASSPTIPLVIANINFSESDPRDDSLKALYGNQGEEGKSIYPYIVITTDNGKKLGIFGLMGIDAALSANADPVTFSTDIDDMANTAQQIVNTLRNGYHVDSVIALAHLGILPDGISGESVELAKRVSGIDIMMSGHQHTALPSPIAVACETEGCNWTTYIMEAGNYGEYIGRYTLNLFTNPKQVGGSLITVNDTIIGNSAVTTYIQALINDLQTNIIPIFDGILTGDYFQKLAHSDFDLNLHSSENNNIGYLLTDSIRAKTGTQTAFAGNGGDLRSSLMRTQDDTMCLADAFISTPLGFGPDNLIGYPLTKFCLALAEIKSVLEATTCNYGLLNNDYMMESSGLRIVFDSSKNADDRITKMTLYDNIDESGATTLIYDSTQGGYLISPLTLISTSTSIYDVSFLVKMGLLPRNCSTGETTSDLASLIVRDDSDKEVKLWYTFVETLNSYSSGVSELYNDAYPPNPQGPYWRRAWNTNEHPCDGHSYCQ